MRAAIKKQTWSNRDVTCRSKKIDDEIKNIGQVPKYISKNFEQ